MSNGDCLQSYNNTLKEYCDSKLYKVDVISFLIEFTRLTFVYL